MSFTQSRESEFLDRLTRIIEARLSDEQFGVSELAQEAGMSRSNLHRRLKSAVGISISQFIRQVRLEKAHSLLQESTASISEIAFECGFHSVSYFSKCFHDHYDYPPGQLRKDDALFSGTGDKKRKIVITVISGCILIAAALILLLILKPKGTRAKSSEISIAVLPIRNDSPTEEGMDFINSLHASIIDKLSLIGNIRVIERRSVEQYRDEPSHVIAKELNVSFLLDGHCFKSGDEIKLTLMLIEAKREKRLWTKPYPRKAAETFDMISEIPLDVAEQINAVITPEERKQIEQEPTTNLKAVEYYHRGSDLLYNFFMDWPDTTALKEAEALFYKALEHDSSYADVYARLASIYGIKGFFGREKGSWEDILDSSLRITEIALSLDQQCSDAHRHKGWCLEQKGQAERALKAYNLSLKYNPNNWEAYMNLGAYYEGQNNQRLALVNYYKASTLHRGKFLPDFYRNLGRYYVHFGFEEQARHYYQAQLQLTGDSIYYYSNISWLAHYFYHPEEAIYASEKVLAKDSGHVYCINRMAYAHMYLGNYEESLRYWHRLESLYGDALIWKMAQQRIAFVYHQLGNREKADEYLDKILDFSNTRIESGEANYADYYNLAGVLAFRGDKEMALHNLRIYRESIPDFILQDLHSASGFIRRDAMFDHIRNEPDFQKVVSELDARYKEVADEIREWLEENDLL